MGGGGPVRASNEWEGCLVQTQHAERERGTPGSGPNRQLEQTGLQVGPSKKFNYIKIFQIHSNLNQFEIGIPELKKYEIK
jgi:hypothetical protein